MRRLFLAHAAPGDLLEDVFVVTGKQLAATAAGKYYIKGFISDRTCQIPARMWNATREIFSSLPDSGFTWMRGRVENYQGNLQIIMEQVGPARDGTFDVSDLMPHTERDINTMCSRLYEMCGSIQNRHLAAIVQAYLDDESLMAKLCRAPAAMSFHHAFIGGLLEHTLNAMEVADAVVRFYPGLSRDLVLAGIFLHDIAKTWELTYESAFGYSDSGQLVGHIVKSAIWVEDKARQAEQALGERIPQQLIDVLQHIIISHHGTPEHGAVKIPGTPEAIAVHMIENMDAKLMIALSACRGEPAAGATGNWTDYIKAFGVRLFRPDVAPCDAAEVPPPEQPPAPPQAKPQQPPAPAQPAPTAPHAPAAAEPANAARINNPLFEPAPAKKR